jgi:hypothetical protein
VTDVIRDFRHAAPGAKKRFVAILFQQLDRDIGGRRQLTQAIGECAFQIEENETHEPTSGLAGISA